MESYLLALTVLGNIAIALSYGGIGMWIVPKMDMAASARGIRLAKMSATAFFFCCAVTHGEMAFHDLRGLPQDPTSWHYVLNTVVQAIAAPVFAIVAGQYLAIRIIDKAQYEQVLDRRLIELERRREELVRKALDEAGDVTTDVYRALGAPKPLGETGDSGA